MEITLTRMEDWGRDISYQSCNAGWQGMTGSYTTEDVRMGIAPDIGVRRAATLDRVGAVVFMYTWKTGRRAPLLAKKVVVSTDTTTNNKTFY